MGLEAFEVLGTSARLGSEAAAEPADDRVTDEGRPARVQWRRIIPLAIVALLLFGAGALAKTGYWRKVAEREGLTGSQASTTDYVWVDTTDGEVPTTITTTVMSSTSPSDIAPPDGYDQDQDHTPSDDVTDQILDASGYDGSSVSINPDEVDPQGAILGKFDKKSDTWSNPEPYGLLNIMDKVRYNVVSCIAQITNVACRFGQSILGLIDPSGLFGASFRTGDFAPFYKVAQRVHNSIAVPLGSGFLGVAFVVELIKLTDRRRYGGGPWFEPMLRLLMMYMVTWTLVNHALEVMELLYWLGTKMYEGTAAALTMTGRGIASITYTDGAATQSLSDVGANITEALSQGIGTVTYEQWATSAIYLVLAAVVVGIEAKLTINIAVTAIMRMGEIYLRAAFAGIPLAFLVTRDTRPTTVSYLKRFGAACALAAVLVVSLSIAGPMVGIVSRALAFGTARGSAYGKSLAGAWDAIRLCTSTFIALWCVDGIVKKSSDVANSMFGL